MVWVRVGFDERAIRCKNLNKAWRRAKFMQRLSQYGGKDLYILTANNKTSLFNGRWKATRVSK